MTTISSKALQELGAAQMNCADVSSELVRAATPWHIQWLDLRRSRVQVEKCICHGAFFSARWKGDMQGAQLRLSRGRHSLAMHRAGPDAGIVVMCLMQSLQNELRPRRLLQRAPWASSTDGSCIDQVSKLVGSWQE
eukprot:s767_g12.t1